jgi:hypothetical protein
MSKLTRSPNRYGALLEGIFFDHWKKELRRFEFGRDEFERWAKKLNIKLPKNLGDLIYSFRFRAPMPSKIRDTEPKGKEWRIELAGIARYRFVLGPPSRILPRTDLIEIKIPDATPELIGIYALDDEQALLAIVRYNRLIDIFLEITTYSLQNHLRTTVKGIGQIEIDELYVGIDKAGRHYVIPVQAKGGKDQISGVQTSQDIAACEEKFPGSRCRAISMQFMKDKVIAMFELVREGDVIKVLEERHYRLVPANELN